MKYYSEMLNEIFDTEEELCKAEEKVKTVKAEKERKVKELKEERAKRAKEVESAQAKAVEAIKYYRELLSDFCEDYGSFHMTLDNNYPVKDFMEIFRSLF